MLRGNERKDIFYDNKDRIRFLDTLNKKICNELIKEIREITGAPVRDLPIYMGISKDIVFRT